MTITGNGVQVPDGFSERLMSIPMLPTQKRSNSDGSEPQGSAKSTALATTDSPPQSKPSGKTLESVSDEVAYKTVDMLVRSQDRLARNRWAIDTHYKRVDSGVPFSRLEKIPNMAMWVAKLPPGANKESTAAVPNKASDLCNKVVDALLADPPKPNPQSHTDSEGAEEAGDLASEFLRLDGGEAGTNDVQQYRWALRNALVSSSSFLHYTINEDGAGYQPMQVMADPNATDVSNPLIVQIPQPDGTVIEQHCVDPILRYVSPPSQGFPDGQFVTDPSQADKVWLPATKIDKLSREQVRCFPATASVEDADAVVLLLWCSLSEATAIWPDVAKMTQTQLEALATWKPAMADTLVPYTFRGGLADGMSGPSFEDVGSLSPLMQRRMYYYRLYVKKSREYPGGMVMDTNGSNGGTVLNKDALEYSVTVKDGTETRCMDIPVVQITPLQDVAERDPMGWPFMARFAGSSEATATLYAAYLDALDQRLHPHLIIRSNVPVDEDDWSDRTKPIVLGAQDAEPTWEQFPPMPDIVGVIENLHQEQDTSSGLTATAQGLETVTSESGVSKQLTIRQAQVSLAGMQQQLLQAFTRGWRIKLQLFQKFFSTPRMLKYSGEDGSAQVAWFSAEDVAGIDDIGIEPGTGTMMTAEAKANYVAFLQGQQWLTPDRAAKVGMAGISRDLGLPPDPAAQAIGRAIKAWLDGPDPQWIQQVEAVQRGNAAAAQAWQQVAQAAQMKGLQPPPQMPPQQPPPPSTNPFPVRPNDGEPPIATQWMQRLSDLILTSQYMAMPEPWKALVDARYASAVQALQPPMQLPKGVNITVPADATTIAADEQAAIQGLSGKPQQAAPAPTAQPQQPMAAQ